MLRYMLDTNLCVRVLRDRPPGLVRRFQDEATGLAISTIILAELHVGAGRSARPRHHRDLIDAFASRLTVLPFDEEAAHHAADIRCTLESLGTPIGAYDTLIAGHARSRGLTLVSGNLREFHRVGGLDCEDWPSEART